MCPKRDLTVAFAEFQVIHDQARLLRIVDVETCLGSGNCDLHPGPHARFEIHVGLIPFRVLRAETMPGKIRLRRVLDGVIAL